MNEESARDKNLRHRLGERFPGVHHPSLVDKDHTALTSDRRAHQEQRAYFLGEVFFAETAAFDNLRHILRPNPALVTLVTVRSKSPGDAVTLAPSAKLRPAAPPHPGVWQPAPGMKELRPETTFLLHHARPVPRHQISGHLDTVSGKDKQSLATQLAALNRTPQP